MTTKNKAKAQDTGIDEHYATTRLLLTLWTMGGADAGVKKGELTGRLKRKGETSGDYQTLLAQLEEAEAIATEKNKRVVDVKLTDKGLQMLSEELKNPKFEFDSQIGVKTANALLRWFREQGTAGDGAVASANGAKASKGKIASYEEFKPVALDVYGQLNRDYNLDDLVPIYRIRREIGDRVSRSQFDEWLLEMQTNDLLQLIGGEMPDITPDKAEDSIKTGLGGVRYYAKRL